MSLFDILKRLMNENDNVNEVMQYAAYGGHIETVKLCKEWGTTAFAGAMASAAEFGHVEIVELCKE